MIPIGSKFEVSSGLSLSFILHNSSTVFKAPISGCASRDRLVAVK
jgi:hypothetical protein